MRNFFLYFLLLFPILLHAQKQAGIEQYYYTRQPGTSAVVPMAYFKTGKNWYGTVRYNYEEVNTIAVHAGKTFTGKGAISWEVTPMAGLLAGQYKGGSLSTQVSLSWKKWELYTEPQYVHSLQSKEDHFWYSWTDLTYEAAPFFYTGLSLQHTRLQGKPSLTEPGVMAGLTFKNLQFPLYLFRPLRQERYFVLGLTWQWQQ